MVVNRESCVIRYIVSADAIYGVPYGVRWFNRVGDAVLCVPLV